MNSDPAAYLPHRFPFLMLDRVVDLSPGVEARAEVRITNGADGFPQVFLVECIAQLGGIVAVSEEGEGGFLASINHAQFGDPPGPGDTLMVHAKVLASFGRLFLIEGEVTCRERTLLKSQMSLGVGRL